MDDNQKVTNNAITCPECQNMNNYEDELHVGDIAECPFCGSELRITGTDGTVEVVEEEK